MANENYGAATNIMCLIPCKWNRLAYLVVLVLGDIPEPGYFGSTMNVGAIPAADEKPVLPVDNQLEHPWTLPR